MKLREVKDREYKGKKYVRYQIHLPKKTIENLKWKDGDDIEVIVGSIVEEKNLKRFLLLRKTE